MLKIFLLSLMLGASPFAIAETQQEFVNNNVEGVYFVNATYAFLIRKIEPNKFEWHFACRRLDASDGVDGKKLVCGGVVHQFEINWDGTFLLPMPMNGLQKVWIHPQMPNLLQSKKDWIAESEKDTSLKMEDVYFIRR